MRGSVARRLCEPDPVTEWLSAPGGLEVLAADRLRLVEVAAPPLSAEEQALTDRAWDEAVEAKPSLFDGPVAASGRLGWEGPGTLALSWIRTTYRRYVPREVPGASCWLPHLFVSVLQPTEEGALMVGRMASWTAAPGRWQLPSGTGEPPKDAVTPLDLADLRALAARELREETGAEIPPADLRLWRVTHGPQGDVGALFLAPPRPAAWLREQHAALIRAERAMGRHPELEEIAFVHTSDDLAALGQHRADYLEPVLRQYA